MSARPLASPHVRPPVPLETRAANTNKRRLHKEKPWPADELLPVCGEPDTPMAGIGSVGTVMQMDRSRRNVQASLFARDQTPCKEERLHNSDAGGHLCVIEMEPRTRKRGIKIKWFINLKIMVTI